MPPDKGNVKKSPAVKQETNIQGKSTTTKRDLKETSGKSTLTIKSIYGSHSTTDSKTKTLSVSKTKEQPQKDDPESKLEPQKEMSEKKRNSTVQKSRQALGKVKSETGKGKLSSQDVKNIVTTQSHTLVKNVVKTMSYHIPAKNTDSGDTLTHRSQRSYRTTTQGTPEKVRTKVKKENTASSTKPQLKDRSHYQTWRDTRETITKTKDTNIKLKTTAGNVKTLSTELKNKMTIKESRKHRNNQVDKESRNKEVYKESRNKLGDKYSRTKPVIEKTRQKPVDKERQNKPLDKNEPKSKLDNTTPEAGTKKLHRERTRTRTLSPTEVKMAQSIQAEIEKEQQMKREKSESSTKPSPSRTMANDTSNTDDEEEISDSIDKDDYEDDFEDYEPDFEDHTNSDISDKESVGIGTDSANTMTDVDDDDDDEVDVVDNDDVDVVDNDDGSSNHDISEDGAVGLTPRQHPLVEEEKKLDSGNYDLADRRRKEREMQEIKMALERENLDLEERRKKSSGLVGSLVIPVDEGFEEEKVEETKSSVSTSLHHTQFINFANARKRQIEKRASAKSKKRGEELLDMIRLDAMSYSLFDIAPIPYEVYMKSYGRSNAVQALAQTNEDNLSEEVQTDEIICKNKWTQKPVSFCTKIDSKINDKKKDLLMFSQEHLGVGGDFLEENALGWSNRIKTDSARFNQFLSTTGQVMLILLEESYTQNGGELIMNPVDLGFSDGFTSLGVSDVPFLAERAVTSICFPHHLTTMLLTVHQRLQRAACTDYNPVLGRSLICVWNTLEPSSPQKILVAGQEVTACYLESSHAGLVFGGLADGSVCIWDLREPSSYHTMVTAADQSQWIIRSPTYNTAEILREEGHLGPVVALQPFIEAESKSDTYYSNELSPTQVCSLEESGIIMVWTVIQSQEKGSKSGMSQQDLGLAHWGRVLLHRSSTIRIQDTLALDSVHRNNLQCYDLRMDVQDTEHLYVATNTGQVVHCLKSGGKPSPRTYIPNCDGFTSAKCIETCPFDQPFFLVGGIEGSVRLHSRASEKPLTMLAGTGDVLGQGPPIIALQWSRCRPCVFFALDTSSRIHVWDLSAGDMYPQYSVPFSDKTITAIQLSPLSESGKETSQLVLATECGKVEIHNLKPELNYQSTVEFNKELETFLRYTSIL